MPAEFPIPMTLVDVAISSPPAPNYNAGYNSTRERQ
jgi:hypothetical protein